MKLFDFFLNSANLNVEVWISFSISEFPLHFEITRIDCISEKKKSIKIVHICLILLLVKG